MPVGVLIPFFALTVAKKVRGAPVTAGLDSEIRLTWIAVDEVDEDLEHAEATIGKLMSIEIANPITNNEDTF